MPYATLVILVAVIAVVLQTSWMDRIKRTGGKDVVPPAFAEKLSRWMLKSKGLDPESLAALNAQGVEKIQCETCLGTGNSLSAAGRKDICPICLGVGFHVIRRLDPADRICPACSGMGRTELPDTGQVGTCPRCGGRGLIRTGGAGSAPPPDGN